MAQWVQHHGRTEALPYMEPTREPLSIAAMLAREDALTGMVDREAYRQSETYREEYHRQSIDDKAVAVLLRR
jgi:hypothetical protein